MGIPVPPVTFASIIINVLSIRVPSRIPDGRALWGWVEVKVDEGHKPSAVEKWTLPRMYHASWLLVHEARPAAYCRLSMMDKQRRGDRVGKTCFHARTNMLSAHRLCEMARGHKMYAFLPQPWQKVAARLLWAKLSSRERLVCRATIRASTTCPLSVHLLRRKKPSSKSWRDSLDTISRQESSGPAPRGPENVWCGYPKRCTFLY